MTVSTRVLLLELNRRDVDRDFDIIRPGRGLGAGRPEHPFADATIRPVSSATGMNSAGETRPRSG